MRQRLLITHSRFEKLSGSEMVVLELIEEFIRLDWDVVLYVNYFGGVMSKEVDKSQYRIHLTITTDENDINGNFDLIWIQNSLLPLPVIRMLNQGMKTKIVWYHMSTIAEIEQPILANIEGGICDKILMVSQKTKERLLKFGLPEDKTIVFPNAVPASFLTKKQDVVKINFRKILIVSNHPPAEVLEAREILKKKGLTVDLVGRKSVVRRVTAELLDDYDAVVTIGKTVYYAIGMGIPVYEYDRYGGAGWITDKNFESEVYRNFSGIQDKRRISARNIVDEIIDGFDDAKKFRNAGVEIIANKFNMAKNLDQLLHEIDSVAKIKKISKADALVFEWFCRLYRTLYLQQKNK